MLSTNIETERLILKPLKEGDAQALYEIFSDHDVMKYWNTSPWQSISDAKSFIKNSTEAMHSNSEIVLGIYLKSNDTLLGKILLFNYVQESRRAEIGFGIGSHFWGKGIVSEAAKALVAYAFDTLNLRRIEAEIDPDNVSSGNVLKRLGFIKEGVLRERWEINGAVSDSALYGLIGTDRASI